MDKQLLDSLNNLSLSLTEISNSLNRVVDSKSVGSVLSDPNFSNQILEISNSISSISDYSLSIVKTQENLIKNQETILNILKENNEKFDDIKSKLTSIEKSQKSIIEIGKDSNSGLSDLINERIDEIKEMGKSISDKITDTNTISEINKSISEVKESDSRSDISAQKSHVEIMREISRISESAKDSSIEKKTDTVKELGSTSKEIEKDKTKIKSDTIKEIVRESKTINGKESNGIVNSVIQTIKEIAREVKTNQSKEKIIDRESNKEKFKNVESKTQTVKEMGSKSKEVGFFGKIKDNIKDVKNGVSTILLIASGILAIGMAFKVIGQVDFASVLALSVSLPLIAIAFHKISQIGLDPKDVKSVIISIVGISTAIALSSFILSTVKPIGLFQAITSILIAGVFTAISYGISKLLKPFKGLGISDAIKASYMLPLLMVGISAAIAGSSHILGMVKPIGLPQAITSILIAGMFTAISYGMFNLLRSFKRINVSDAIKASAILPMAMIGMSAAIVGSSYLLGLVKPIGLFQAITSILIAGVFTAISYGVFKLVSGFKDLSVGDALRASLVMPIILVALSGAIMASSQLLSMVKPIGLFQALTSIIISGIFVVLSHTVKPLLSGIKGVSYGDILKGSVIILALAGTISAASYIIGGMKEVTMSQIFSFIGIGISIGIVSVVFGGAVKVLNKIGGPSEFIKGGISIIAISGAIALSSIILSVGDYTSYPSIEWALNSGLSLAMFAIGAVLLGSTAMTPMFWVGLGAVVVTSLAITAVSYILGAGDYTKYPSIEWALNSGLSLAMFGVGAVLLGTTAMTPMFWVGLGAIVVTALTITATSYIIGMGDYTKYPDLSWSLGVGLSIAGFGLGATILGFQAINPFFYDGLGVILLVAGTIVGVSYILGSGNYDKSPPMGWALSVGSLIAGFGIGAAALGVVSPLVLLGLLAATAVAGTIYLIDKIFSSGSFKKYPSEKWITPAVSIVSKFGISMVGLAFALPLIALGSLSTLAIVGTIILMDKALSSGQYVKYPTQKWTSGVFTTLKDISNLLTYIRNNLGFADLALGAIKIWGVIKSLKMIDEALSEGKFAIFPSSKWNQGVKETLVSMMDLMSIPSFITVMRDRIASFFGGGLDDVAKTIVNIDKIFSLGKYQLYPSKIWVNGSVSAISEFINLGNNKSILSSIYDLIKSGLGSGLEDIAHKIVSIDRIFSTGEFIKFPNVDWAKSISSSIKSIGDISKLDIPDISDSTLNKISSVFDKISSIKLPSIPIISVENFSSIQSLISKMMSVPTYSISDVSKNSKFITDAIELIKSISSSISGISYSSNFPTSEWITNIGSFISGMGSVFNYIKSANYPSLEIEKFDGMIRISKEISSRVSSFEFPDTPVPKVNTENLINSISSIGNSLSGLDKISLDQILSNRPKMESIVDSISLISQSLSKTPSFTSYPSIEWTSGISKSIEVIGQVNELSIETKEKSSILSSSIIDIINSFSGINSNVNLEWIDNINNSISRIFNSISSYPSINEIQDQRNRIGQLADLMKYLRDRVSSISDVNVDNLNLDSSISSLERMSVAFDKMSKSVDGFVDSLENINTDKISSVGAVANSMILLNTVGEKQFEKIIQRIEERSDRVTEAINNYNRGKSETDDDQLSKVSTPTTIDNRIEIPEMKSLVNKMETMTALLADISSVVGSKGALKNYIMSIQGEVTIGKKT